MKRVQLIEESGALKNPLPRIKKFIYDNPEIKFPDSVRITEENRIYLEVFPRNVVKTLLKMPRDCVKWSPEKYVFKEGRLVEPSSKERVLPRNYNIEITDRESLIKCLKSYKPDNEDEINVLPYLLSVIEANPSLLKIDIKRH